jgi:hypothetical protein
MCSPVNGHPQSAKHSAAVAAMKAAIGTKGQNYSYTQARKALGRLRPGLEALIALLEKCGPKREGDYQVIWADRDNAYPKPLHCTTGEGDGLIETIQSLMRESRVLGLEYAAHWKPGAPPKVFSANFIVFTVGLAGSGASTSIYFREQGACAREHDREDGSSLDVRALDPPHCNWLWEHDEGY